MGDRKTVLERLTELELRVAGLEQALGGSKGKKLHGNYGHRSDGAETLAKVRAFAAQGMSRKQIAEAAGISYPYTCYLLKTEGIEVPPAKKGRPLPSPERLQRIKELAEEGCTREEIGRAVGLSYSALGRICRQNDIKVIHAGYGVKKKVDWKDEDVKDVVRTHTDSEAGRILGVSRERVRQIRFELPDVPSADEMKDFKREQQTQRAYERAMAGERLAASYYTRACSYAIKNDLPLPPGNRGFTDRQLRLLEAYRDRVQTVHTWTELERSHNVKNVVQALRSLCLRWSIPFPPCEEGLVRVDALAQGRDPRGVK